VTTNPITKKGERAERIDGFAAEFESLLDIAGTQLDKTGNAVGVYRRKVSRGNYVMSIFQVLGSGCVIRSAVVGKNPQRRSAHDRFEKAPG
jgi:hypothetical protein